MSVTPCHRGGHLCNWPAFRLNEGNVARHTLDRLDSFIVIVNEAGKRLTYKALIA